AGVESLAEHGGETVMARQGSVLVATFDPELTDDATVHRYFCDLVRRAMATAGSFTPSTRKSRGARSAGRLRGHAQDLVEGRCALGGRLARGLAGARHRVLQVRAADV